MSRELMGVSPACRSSIAAMFDENQPERLPGSQVDPQNRLPAGELREQRINDIGTGQVLKNGCR